MSDPISSALVKGGVKAGATAAHGLLQKLLGPAAEEFGFMLRDKARVYRLKNFISVVAKTEELLRAASIDAHAVPLRTMLPIMDGASLEDDKGLVRKWAGLLASAAAAMEPWATHPSFPRILSEITPHEAIMLDRLLEAGGEAVWPPLRKQLAKDFSCPEDSINSAHWNLFRLGLWVNIEAQAPSQPVLRLTEFGRLFLAVTHGPQNVP
jgi:hypothetical protein